MAKFNSLQNLKVHEEMYCTKKEVQVPENKKSCFENPQNLILLPMAYHDLLQQNAVQVIFLFWRLSTFSCLGYGSSALADSSGCWEKVNFG